nr:hypothetical protein [Tanacetum cinerariifolium]
MSATYHMGVNWVSQVQCKGLITADLREVSYHQEYLANVVKHRWFLSGEPARKPNPTAQKVWIHILQYLIHLRMCKDVPTKMMKMFLLVENLRQQNPDNREMITSVGNNSVLRSFFDKQKLTGPNFIDWYRQLWIILSAEDKEHYLEHPIPAAPVVAHGQQELKTMFVQQAEQELLQTVREFHACKQEEGQSVSSYVLNMKSYIDNLEHLGQPVSLRLAVNLILISMSKEYDEFAPSYALKLKNPPPPKKENPAKDAICHQYGEVV